MNQKLILTVYINNNSYTIYHDLASFNMKIDKNLVRVAKVCKVNDEDYLFYNSGVSKYNKRVVENFDFFYYNSNSSMFEKYVRIPYDFNNFLFISLIYTEFDCNIKTMSNFLTILRKELKKCKATITVKDSIGFTYRKLTENGKLYFFIASEVDDCNLIEMLRSYKIVKIKKMLTSN